MLPNHHVENGKRKSSWGTRVMKGNHTERASWGGAFWKRNRPKARPATVGLTWASKTGLKLGPKIGPKTDVGLRPYKRIN